MSEPLQGVALAGAGAAAAAALLLPGRRERAIAMGSALAIAVGALAAHEGSTLSDSVSGRVALLGVAAVAGLVALAALTVLFRRRPGTFALLAFAAIPFRVPVPIAGDTANLLLPLYGVTAAGLLAYALGWEAGERPEGPDADRARKALRRVQQALALVLVLYGVQAIYTSDPGQATINMCFFYVPFTVLFVLLLEVPWTQRLLVQIAALITALALAFAAVGFLEYATGRLLIVNDKVSEANEIKPYFRVNSLFFDPNIYGRFLALTMLMLAAGLLWSTGRRSVALIAVALGVLWAGMVLSLSQSSFAALLVGLIVLASLRWRTRYALGAAGIVAGVTAAVVLFAPGSVGLPTGKDKHSLDKATSGRSELIRGGLRMVEDRPVYGYGSGAFAERFREREKVRTEQAAAASHTIPVTVSAEQGVIGLIAYLLLLVASFGLVLGGLRAPARRGDAVARAAIGAAFAGLVLHTLVYAAFLEDPLTWALLAVAAALRLAPPLASPAREPAPAPLPHGLAGALA